jgi:hypothetical protein
MVQAALGETWNSDLDIFCTQGAAPAVRSALLRAGYFLEHRDRHNGGSEIRDHHEYGGEASEPFRTIDHVEKYCRQTNADHPRMEEYPEFTRLKPPSVAAEAVEWVTRVNAVDLAGNLLPAHCRWPYCACLDLVVGYNCAMATDVLKFFDITICTASFDGTTFRIPSPHLTFTRRTHIEPARAELMHAFCDAAADPLILAQMRQDVLSHYECPNNPGEYEVPWQPDEHSEYDSDTDSDNHVQPEHGYVIEGDCEYRDLASIERASDQGADHDGTGLPLGYFPSEHHDESEIKAYVSAIRSLSQTTAIRQFDFDLSAGEFSTDCILVGHVGGFFAKLFERQAKYRARGISFVLEQPDPLLVGEVLSKFAATEAEQLVRAFVYPYPLYSAPATAAKFAAMGAASRNSERWLERAFARVIAGNLDGSVDMWPSLYTEPGPYHPAYGAEQAAAAAAAAVAAAAAALVAATAAAAAVAAHTPH